MDDRKYEDWIAVFRTGTDYEADLVRDRLDDAGVPAVVLTQRDHAFNLTVGDLAPVSVMVPPEHVDEAAALLDSIAPTDEELERAAMDATSGSGPAHTREEDSMLDSGNEHIRLSPPDEESDRD
jgi:hypothetical protein